jgi:hypothetical protein
MKSLTTVFTLLIILTSLAFATSFSAWASEPIPAQYWCGTLDRELEIETYADHVEIVDPDTTTGPAIIDQVALQGVTEGQSELLIQAQNERSTVAVSISQTPEAGTDIYPGWITILHGDTTTERLAVTCVPVSQSLGQ